MMSFGISYVRMTWVVMVTFHLVDCGNSRSEIQLENGGLCDTKEIYPGSDHKCKRVIVHGQNFRNSSSITCRLHLIHYVCEDEGECTTHNIVKGNHFKDLRGKFINSSMVLCELYRLKSYYISVGNDRDNLPEPKLYLPYSSLCLHCGVDDAKCVSTLSQRKRYCHYMHTCFLPDEENPHLGCRECKPQSDGIMTWQAMDTDLCQPSRGSSSFPMWAIVILIFVMGTAIIASGFLVYICSHKSQDARIIMNEEETSTSAM